VNPPQDRTQQSAPNGLWQKIKGPCKVAACGLGVAGVLAYKCTNSSDDDIVSHRVETAEKDQDEILKNKIKVSGSEVTSVSTAKVKQKSAEEDGAKISSGSEVSEEVTSSISEEVVKKTPSEEKPAITENIAAKQITSGEVKAEAAAPIDKEVEIVTEDSSKMEIAEEISSEKVTKKEITSGTQLGDGNQKNISKQASAINRKPLPPLKLKQSQNQQYQVINVDTANPPKKGDVSIKQEGDEQAAKLGETRKFVEETMNKIVESTPVNSVELKNRVDSNEHKLVGYLKQLRQMNPDTKKRQFVALKKTLDGDDNAHDDIGVLQNFIDAQVDLNAITIAEFRAQKPKKSESQEAYISQLRNFANAIKPEALLREAVSTAFDKFNLGAEDIGALLEELQWTRLQDVQDYKNSIMKEIASETSNFLKQLEKMLAKLVLIDKKLSNQRLKKMLAKADSSFAEECTATQEVKGVLLELLKEENLTAAVAAAKFDGVSSATAKLEKFKKFIGASSATTKLELEFSRVESVKSQLEKEYIYVSSANLTADEKVVVDKGLTAGRKAAIATCKKIVADAKKTFLVSVNAKIGFMGFSSGGSSTVITDAELREATVATNATAEKFAGSALAQAKAKESREYKAVQTLEAERTQVGVDAEKIGLVLNDAQHDVTKFTNDVNRIGVLSVTDQLESLKVGNAICHQTHLKFWNTAQSVGANKLVTALSKRLEKLVKITEPENFIETNQGKLLKLEHDLYPLEHLIENGGRIEEEINNLAQDVIKLPSNPNPEDKSIQNYVENNVVSSVKVFLKNVKNVLAKMRELISSFRNQYYTQKQKEIEHTENILRLKHATWKFGREHNDALTGENYWTYLMDPVSRRLVFMKSQLSNIEGGLETIAHSDSSRATESMRDVMKLRKMEYILAIQKLWEPRIFDLGKKILLKLLPEGDENRSDVVKAFESPEAIFENLGKLDFEWTSAGGKQKWKKMLNEKLSSEEATLAVFDEVFDYMVHVSKYKNEVQDFLSEHQYLHETKNLPESQESVKTGMMEKIFSKFSKKVESKKD